MDPGSEQQQQAIHCADSVKLDHDQPAKTTESTALEPNVDRGGGQTFQPAPTPSAPAPQHHLQCQVCKELWAQHRVHISGFARICPREDRGLEADRLAQSEVRQPEPQPVTEAEPERSPDPQSLRCWKDRVVCSECGWLHLNHPGCDLERLRREEREPPPACSSHPSHFYSKSQRKNWNRKRKKQVQRC